MPDLKKEVEESLATADKAIQALAPSLRADPQITALIAVFDAVVLVARLVNENEDLSS